MDYEKEVKQERSIPVQSRVNLVELAELDRYFNEQGQEIRSMSRLLSWGIGLLLEVLEANDALPTKFESLADANKYLISRGLYQPGMKNRGRKKLGMAMGFENLRLDGINPRIEAKEHFEGMHNSNSIRPFEGKVTSGKEKERMHFKDDIDEAFKRIEEEREKDKKEELDNAIESMRDRGQLAAEPKLEQSSVVREGASQEELDEHVKVNDKEVSARENAPFDIEEVMRLQEERLAKNQVR